MTVSTPSKSPNVRKRGLEVGMGVWRKGGKAEIIQREREFYHIQLQEGKLGPDPRQLPKGAPCSCANDPCKRKFCSYHIAHPPGKLLLIAIEV